MNIVVCLKAVPTPGRNPIVNEDGSGIIYEGEGFMNESDDYALEQALLLKRNTGAKVTAITVGSIKSQGILHVSLAKGADDVIRIDGDEFDPNVTSFLLARAVSALNPDLVLSGVESADGMSSQVPISLAAQLGIPYVYAVTKVDADAEQGPLVVVRELGGGRYQTLEVTTPALLCIQSGIVPLTYTPVVKLIHARRRGIPCLSLESLNITEAELSERRKTKILNIKPVETKTTTLWLKGNSQELATQILEKIGEAL